MDGENALGIVSHVAVNDMKVDVHCNNNLLVAALLTSLGPELMMENRFGGNENRDNWWNWKDRKSSKP